ncbi:MAG: WD40/YVTN/BNR-like repeat-containing protein, partial [Candidatus Promineifilaceae bacterium]
GSRRHDGLGDFVFAGTQGQGVFISGDAGATWKPSGMDGQVVKSLAISPLNPSKVYAGVKPAYIFESDDGGESWSEIESFRKIRGRRLWFSPAESPFKAYVQSIAPSPTDPNVIVAGIEFGAVIRSEDGGASWSNHMSGSLRDCHNMTFHSVNGDWIYESGGSGGGVSVSRDGGRTWRQANEGLDRNYGWACAADPVKPEVWYASLSPMAGFPKMVPAAHVDGEANAYIYRSSGGAPWQKLTGGLPEPLDYMAYSLKTIPGVSGLIFTGLANGEVWRSENFGDDWEQLPFNFSDIHREMIVLPS